MMGGAVQRAARIVRSTHLQQRNAQDDRVAHCGFKNKKIMKSVLICLDCIRTAS